MASALFLTLLVFLPLCWAKSASSNNFETQEETIASLVNSVQSLARTVKTLQKEVNSLKHELFVQSTTRNFTSAENSDSIFLATIGTGSIPISDDEVVVFDTASINPGGHYSTVTGGYTAPYNGYYQFSVTKESNDYRCHFWILVDEQRYTQYGVYVSAGENPSCSATINLQLTAGQIVRVENDFSTLIYGTDSAGSIQSWFTGHMLYVL